MLFFKKSASFDVRISVSNKRQVWWGAPDPPESPPWTRNWFFHQRPWRLSVVFCHRIDYKANRLLGVWEASGTHPSKIKPGNSLLLFWLLIMVIRASVIFLSTVYADAVKVKPFRNRLFAPPCVAMRNAFKKLYLKACGVQCWERSRNRQWSGLWRFVYQRPWLCLCLQSHLTVNFILHLEGILCKTRHQV